jgi:Tol biopolymer transport system component
MVGSLDGAPPRRVSADFDSRAVFVAGYLLFVRDGVLLAQPFDPDKARLTGDAKPLVDDLHYFRSLGSAAFTVSDNGLLAWRSARRPSRLAWIDRSGTETGSVGTAPFLDGGRLSPDGSRLAIGIVDPKHGASDVWSYDLARGSAERHTFQLLDEKAPVWAPDGRTIYYRSDSGGGPPDIAEFRLGEERRAWVYRGGAAEEPLDVSSDGKWLLVSNSSSTGTDLNALPLKPPGPLRPLVATPFNELSPRFSPDGRWVAYQSDLSGRPEVYVRTFEGTAETRRVSKDGGTRPRWGRDGRELFFLGQAGRLMAVAMSADGMPSTPRTLFQAAGALDFDVAPDGRFLVQLEERSADPTVHLLINWPARLSRP